MIFVSSAAYRLNTELRTICCFSARTLSLVWYIPYTSRPSNSYSKSGPLFLSLVSKKKYSTMKNNWVTWNGDVDAAHGGCCPPSRDAPLDTNRPYFNKHLPIFATGFCIARFNSIIAQWYCILYVTVQIRWFATIWDALKTKQFKLLEICPVILIRLVMISVII